MPLVLDGEQTLLRDNALEFARKRLPVANLRGLRDAHDATGFDRDAWREIAALGWTGMLVPEDCGGNGYGHFGLGIVLEALGRTLAATPLLSTVVLCGTALRLAAAGSPFARELLAQVAVGEAVLAFAHEESPQHLPLQVATTARRDGDGYVLDGRKRFVVDGHVADRFVVVARSSGATGDRAGLSLFVVDGQAEGLTRRRLQMVDSRNAADVDLAGVRVASSALLGTAGEAAPAIERTLDVARILLSAEMSGMAQQAFETTLDYLRQRQQFGVIIGTFQALKHRAVAMYNEIELSKSVLYESLDALDRGRDADIPRLASLCKARLNETLHLVSLEAIQLHGGIGMTDQADVGLYLKRARVAEATLGGTAFHRDRYASLRDF